MGPSLATEAQLLSFNRTQSKVVTGLLTAHNTLKRYVYLMGLSNNPTCRRCGTEEETSVHILYVCGAWASLRHAYLCSFFLDPEDIMNLIMGAIWNFKGTGLLLPTIRSWAQGPLLRPRCIRPRRARAQVLFYSILFYSTPLIHLYGMNTDSLTFLFLGGSECSSFIHVRQHVLLGRQDTTWVSD